MSKKNKNKFNQKKAIKARIESKNRSFEESISNGIHPENRWCLGVLVSHLHASEQAFYLIRSANDFLSKCVGVDIILYAENLSNICVPSLCPVMPMESISFHDGPIIATNLGSLTEIYNLNIAGPKYLYIMDPQTLMDAGNILSDKIRVITASQDYAKIFKARTGIKPIGVVPHFNIEKMVQNIGSEILNG